MTNAQELQLKGFEAAKTLAFQLPINTSKRARVNSLVCNYTGCNLKGRFFVIGDSVEDLQNTTIEIDNKPAREVFEDFTIMSK